MGALEMAGDGPFIGIGILESGGDKAGGPEAPAPGAPGDEAAVDANDSFGFGGARGFPGGEKKYLGIASS